VSPIDDAMVDRFRGRLRRAEMGAALRNLGQCLAVAGALCWAIREPYIANRYAPWFPNTSGHVAPGWPP
jgi:hypothetical protein